MGRPRRVTRGGICYHVLNRANAGARIFATEADCEAFERVLADAMVRVKMRLLCYTVMPTHFHLVVWPRQDGDLSEFAGWLCLTHTQRWHSTHGTVGLGHIYQGRFKSFPIQRSGHFLRVCHYVERNPVRAGLLQRAEEWRWGSLWLRCHSDERPAPELTEWPVPRPADWLEEVNRPLSARDELAIQQSIQRGRPYGEADWQRSAAAEFGLESTLRPRGRPGKGV
jgi:putative transposase